MRHSNKKNTYSLITAGLLGAGMLMSQSALAAPGGNGNGSGNAGGNGTAAQLAAIEADIAALQAEVGVLAQSIELLGVNAVTADCAGDAGALQAAIDAAPPAGAIISVEGLCNGADITGKPNLLLDGGDIASGNGVSGELNVRGSSNIQISGINAGSMGINSGSTVFVGDFAVAGDVTVEVNSSMIQEGGSVSIAGNLSVLTGGRVAMDNGSLNGFGMSRNASLILNAFRPDGPAAITVTGSLGVFSGSHFLAQAFSGDNPSSVTINGDSIFIQRTAAALFAGDSVVLNAPAATARQNSVLDVINMSEANFNVPTINLTQGGGARLVFFDGTIAQEANCDDSAWTDFFITCAP